MAGALGEARQFLEMLSAERGASANTLDAYRRDLESFCLFLDDEGLSLTEVATAHVRQYIGRLETEGLAAASRARRLSAVRQLFKFLEADGRITDNPAETIGGPKRERPLPRLPVDYLPAPALFRVIRRPHHKKVVLSHRLSLAYRCPDRAGAMSRPR